MGTSPSPERDAGGRGQARARKAGQIAGRSTFQGPAALPRPRPTLPPRRPLPPITTPPVPRCLRIISVVLRRHGHQAAVPLAVGAFVAPSAASLGAIRADTTTVGPDVAVSVGLHPESLAFGFTLPATLEESGFAQISALRLPLAALGYRLRYGGEDRPSVDLYLYPVAPDGEPVRETGPGSRENRSRESLEQGTFGPWPRAGREPWS